jgi:UDPglucose--hexose-1-phosphate uridylyltransferase
MPELRKDYLLDRYVIIATERAKRPQQFMQLAAQKSDKSKCPFCPENEYMLPGVVDEVIENNQWVVRSVINKYAAVQFSGNPVIQTDNKFFTYASAYGKHEVVVESRDHDAELEDLPVEHIQKVLQMYIKRINALNTLPNIKYVSVFKNRGLLAGASVSHSHTQIIAYNALPMSIEQELKKTYDFYIKNESCPFCEIITIEKMSYRRVFENKHFICFTPYASRFPFEIWIFSRRHVSTMTQLNDDEILGLAEMLKKILQRLDTLNYPPFNIQFHNAQPSEPFHFHLEIAPRLSTWAGFEISTDTIINTMTPEDAAEFYRGERQG